MGYRAVRVGLLVSAVAVGYFCFGSWIWAILGLTARTVAYVASYVATNTWQAVNPQPTTYSSLPELHQVLLNVTTDATRVADLLHEFMLQDPQLRSKFIAFLQQKANTSYTQVDQQLSWVLWLYSILWMPLLVVTCLARASGTSSSIKSTAAAAAGREDVPVEDHSRRPSSSSWGMPGAVPAETDIGGPPPRSSSMERFASGRYRQLDGSIDGTSRRSLSVSSSRQPSLSSQLHPQQQDTWHQAGQQQDIPRTKGYSRSRTISHWSSAYEDSLLAAGSLDRQAKALRRSASVNPRAPGSHASSEYISRHAHPAVSDAPLDEAALEGLAAAAAAGGDTRGSSDWATAFRRATTMDARSFRSAPMNNSWSETASVTGLDRKLASSGSKAAGQLGLATTNRQDGLVRMGSSADTALRSSDQQP